MFADTREVVAEGPKEGAIWLKVGSGGWRKISEYEGSVGTRSDRSPSTTLAGVLKVFA
jgi:hypothetical protein